MHDLLVTCLAVVFPNLPRDQIASADSATLADWDSLATVTLLGLIEEQLGCKLPDDAVEHLSSFAAALAYLKDQEARAG